MKVLFLSQIVPYPPHGGVLQRGYHILHQLGRRAEVHLLAFLHPDELPTPDLIAESRQALGTCCVATEYFPLWAKTSPLHKAAALAGGILSPMPFSTMAHRSPAFQQRVDALLAGGGFDIVHVDTIALNRFLARRPSLPVVLTHHNIESQLLARRAVVETRALPRWVLERESRKLAAYEASEVLKFDANLMMSVPDEQLLRARVAGVRTAIVPNGVDTTYFTPTATVQEPAVIYTGGMNMLANRDAVLHFVETIWPAVVAQVPDVTFYAVGQDPPAELRAAAERDPRIVVTGKVADVRPYVQRSAVYIVPIRVGGGTRLKVLDAMASGKALVSTSIGCEGIAVSPGRDLLVADEPAPFASAVIELLRNPERRAELGRAARELVERTYAWPVIGDMLFAAYEFAADGYRARIARRSA